MYHTSRPSKYANQDATRRARPTIFQGSVIALQYDSILPHTNTIILQVSYYHRGWLTCAIFENRCETTRSLLVFYSRL